MEVCSVSRRVISLPLNPYLTHYKPAFASSILLYLLPYRYSLQNSFPCRRTTGLPLPALSAAEGSRVNTRVI